MFVYSVDILLVYFKDPNPVLPESHLFRDLPGKLQSQTQLQTLSLGPWLVLLSEPVLLSAQQGLWKHPVLRDSGRRTQACASNPGSGAQSVGAANRPSYAV